MLTKEQIENDELQYLRHKDGLILPMHRTEWIDNVTIRDIKTDICYPIQLFEKWKARDMELVQLLMPDSELQECIDDSKTVISMLLTWRTADAEKVMNAITSGEVKAIIPYIGEVDPAWQEQIDMIAESGK